MHTKNHHKIRTRSLVREGGVRERSRAAVRNYRRTWQSFGSLFAGAALLYCIFLSKGSCAQGGPPPLPVPPGNLLNAWHFDDTNNWVSAAGLPPKSWHGLLSAPSWQSNAVVIEGTTALLQYNEIETNGLTNIVCPNGTIYLWFLPNWSSASSGGSGPGVYGRLIEMGAYTTNASYGWWSLYLNPGGTNIFFGGQTNGAGATYLSSSVAFTSNTWTFLALAYSPSNSFLYTNGQLCATGSGVSYWPSPSVRATNGFSIGSDSSGLNIANGQFEWMRTYNWPLGAVWVSNFYQMVVQDYGGGSPPHGPLGPSGGLKLLAGMQGTNLLLTISGGTNGLYYDFFCATNLVGNSISNSYWTWLGQGTNGQTYLFTSQPRPNAWYVLGTPQDTDGDSLTDAWEELVTHSDPNVAFPPFKVFITQPDPQAFLP